MARGDWKINKDPKDERQFYDSGIDSEYEMEGGCAHFLENHYHDWKLDREGKATIDGVSYPTVIKRCCSCGKAFENFQNIPMVYSNPVGNR